MYKVINGGDIMNTEMLYNPAMMTRRTYGVHISPANYHTLTICPNFPNWSLVFDSEGLDIFGVCGIVW